jgi:protein SCO1/2
MQGEREDPKRLRQVRTLLWILVAIALVGMAVLLLLPRGANGPEPRPVDSSFGGQFTLVDTQGKPFPSSLLDGKPYAIFFGFTHCPDVCPTTLARLAKLRQSAGGNGAFNIVFVSIDPERDGPKEMREYSTLFRTPIIALTGSPAQIDQVKKSYGIFAEKEAMPGGQHAGHSGYSMNHTSGVLLFDGNGKLAGMISATDSDDAALAKLKTIAA